MSSPEVDEFLTDFSRFYLLLLLYEEPSHGYALIQKFRERLHKEVSPSFVYPFLRKLEERGLIEHSLRPVGEKMRKVYRLTGKGRRLCNRLFRRFSTLVSTALEPSMEICANCGCKIYEGGYSEVIDGRRMMFCCVHCAEAYKREREGEARKGLGDAGSPS